MSLRTNAHMVNESLVSAAAPPIPTCRRRRVVGLIAGNLAVLASLLLILEIVGRVCVWYGKIPTEFRPQPFQGFGQTDPVRWWELQPNLDVRFQGVHLRTNRFGLRDNRADIPAGAIRIFCLGDSTSFGWRVEADEMYSAVLERSLNRQSQRPVAVISAGVPGYTSYQTMVQFREQILPLRPHGLVVLSSNNECRARSMGDRTRGEGIARRMALHRMLGFSHFCVLLMRGPESLRRSWELDPVPGRVANDPDEYRQNISELVQLARAHGCRVVVMNVPLRLRYEPTWKTYDNQAGEPARLLQRAQQAGATDELLDRRVALLEQAVQRKPNQFAGHWALAQHYQQMGRQDEADLQFRLAREGDLHPEATKPSYNRLLESLCRVEGVPLVDLENRFGQSGFGDDQLFFDHCHPTPTGHQLIARVLAGHVQELMSDGE